MERLLSSARDRDGPAPVSSRGGEGSSEVLFLRHCLIEPLTLTPADSATPQQQQTAIVYQHIEFAIFCQISSEQLARRGGSIMEDLRKNFDGTLSL